MKLVFNVGCILILYVSFCDGLICSFHGPYVNQQIGGAALSQTQTENDEECKTMCLNNPVCKSINFKLSTKLCYQNYISLPEDSLTAASQVNHYIKICIETSETESSSVQTAKATLSETTSAEPTQMETTLTQTTSAEPTQRETTLIETTSAEPTRRETILTEIAFRETTPTETALREATLAESMSTKATSMETSEKIPADATLAGTVMANFTAKTPGTTPEIATSTLNIANNNETTIDSSIHFVPTHLPLDTFLMWGAWTTWTPCFFRDRFERLRIKLCAVSELDATKDIESTCKQKLYANLSSHQVVLEYATEYEECIPDVDGTWSDWMYWSGCSSSCDAGTKYRKRTCYGQSGNGQHCHGNDIQNQFCSEAECPKDAISILKRREILLPTQVFTESDSHTSNICISISAMIFLLVFIGIILAFDFAAICRRMMTYCVPSIKQFIQQHQRPA